MGVVKNRVFPRGAQLVRLPPVQQITGNRKGNVSPVEHFVSLAVRVERIAGGLVMMDPQKIYIGPEDLAVLEAMHEKYFIEEFGPLQGKDLAGHLWGLLKPREVPGVPVGHVVVDDGSLYIRPEGSVVPGLVH